MKILRQNKRFRTISRALPLILMMLMLVTAFYPVKEDPPTIITDNSRKENNIHKDPSIIGQHLEYSPAPQRYSSNGKMMQGFQQGTSSSTQSVSEFFNGTDSLNNLDVANNRSRTITISSPAGYSGTSGHFNISDVVAVTGDYTQETLSLPSAYWDSIPALDGGDNVQAVSANFTLKFRSNLTSVFVDIGSHGANPTGNITIQGADGTGAPNGTVIAGFNFDLSFPQVWDQFDFDLTLPAGEYTVVLNQTSGGNKDHYYDWFRRSDIGDPDNEQVYTRQFGGGWNDETYDIPLILEVIAIEDASTAARVLTGAGPSAIDFQYNGTAVSSYTSIPMNTSITTHNFTMDTSVRFDVDWLESFENDNNPFDSNPLAYNITDGSLAYWNTSFTATNLGGVSYSIQDRVFNVTIESDWLFIEVLRNEATYGSYTTGSTFVTIDANSITASDTWKITCSAPDYVTGVQVLDPYGILGDPLRVNTTFSGGYDSATANSLNVTYDNTSDGAWTGPAHTPSTNPYTSSDVLSITWTPGSFNVEPFYNTGTKVGIGTASTFVFVPTNVTVLPFGSPVNYTDSEILQAQYFDKTDDSLILGATVKAEIEGSNVTMTDPEVDGTYTYTFDASTRGLGTHNFRVFANKTNYIANVSAFDSIVVESTPTVISQVLPGGLTNGSTITVGIGQPYPFALTWRDANQSSLIDDTNPARPGTVTFLGVTNGNHSFSFVSASAGQYLTQITLEDTGFDPIMFELTFEVRTPTHITVLPYASPVNYTDSTILRAQYYNETADPDSLIHGATLKVEIDTTTNLTMNDLDDDGTYNVTFDASNWVPGDHTFIVYANMTSYAPSISTTKVVRVESTPTRIQQVYPAGLINGSTIRLDTGEVYPFALIWQDINQSSFIDDTNPDRPGTVTFIGVNNGNHSFSFFSAISGQYPVQVTLNETGLDAIMFEINFIVKTPTYVTVLATYDSPLNYTDSTVLEAQYYNDTDDTLILGATLNAEVDGLSNVTMADLDGDGTYNCSFAPYDANLNLGQGTHSIIVYAEATNYHANTSLSHYIDVVSTQTNITQVSPASYVNGTTIYVNAGQSYNFDLTWVDLNQSRFINDTLPAYSSGISFGGVTNGVHHFSFYTTGAGEFHVQITLAVQDRLNATVYILNFAVKAPTDLSITDIDGSAIIGDDIEVEVRLTNDLNGDGIGGMEIEGDTEWGESDSATTNSKGYATLKFDTSDGDRGKRDVDVDFSGATYYDGSDDSDDIRLIEPTRLSSLTYDSDIAFNDSTAIVVTYETDGGSDINGADVKIIINETKWQTTGIGDGKYEYVFFGTQWDYGTHPFRIEADKGSDYDDARISGSIAVWDTPTGLNEAANYADTVWLSPIEPNSTLQMAYMDELTLYLYYNDTLNAAEIPDAVVISEWTVGELPLTRVDSGGNYSFTVVGNTVGSHTLSTSFSKYGYQSHTFMVTFEVADNPTTLKVDSNIPEDRTLVIQYSEVVMFDLSIEDTNHSLPISASTTVSGWSNYEIEESQGTYSCIFYGDQITPNEGQTIEILFQRYGYDSSVFQFTFVVHKRPIIMQITKIDNYENLTAGESIVVHVQLNYTNGDPVPNVEVVAMFTVEFNTTAESSSLLALGLPSLQGSRIQVFNVSGTTDRNGQVAIPFTTEDNMLNIQIAVAFNGDVTKAASTFDYNLAMSVLPRPLIPGVIDTLIEYWYVVLALAIVTTVLFWYFIRRTRVRMVSRAVLDRRIQRTYDFITDIVSLDAIIGILRDGSAFYNLMIGEELDPQLHSSFLTALRTYASSIRDLDETELTEADEKAHALMGEKEYYIASGEVVSFAFLFTARVDESGEWQSISTITRDAAREAVEEIETRYESEIDQFCDTRDLSVIPSDHIYLVFTRALGLDFLNPHRTTGRGKDLTKDEQWALRVSRNIEKLGERLFLPLVAEQLMGEGMPKDRAIYALQQLRVKDAIETVDR